MLPNAAMPSIRHHGLDDFIRTPAMRQLHHGALGSYQNAVLLFRLDRDLDQSRVRHVRHILLLAMAR
jgi:hypothetical protein